MRWLPAFLSVMRACFRGPLGPIANRDRLHRADHRGEGQPFSDADTLSSLPEKSKVEVLERKSGWMQIKAGGTKGWVKNAEPALRRLPPRRSPATAVCACCSTSLPPAAAAAPSHRRARPFRREPEEPASQPAGNEGTATLHDRQEGSAELRQGRASWRCRGRSTTCRGEMRRTT